MAIVIGPCWMNRRILATFGFKRTALRSTQPKIHSMFCTLFLKITLSSAELMSFGHLGIAIWHRWAFKDKCYGDKPESIDALKDNLRKVIGEIQMHTIDNVLKNWIGQPRQPFEWNHSPLLTGRIVLSIKKIYLRKYSVVFF